MRAYIAIHDKEQKGVIPMESYNPVRCKELNEQGYGIFATVNEFEATEEQMKEAGVRTIRNNKFCSKINGVYADLDIAKKGDGSTDVQRELGKAKLLLALQEHCDPNKIIETRNGLQPIWYLEDTDPKNAERAKNVINGIIEWSLQHGAAGDAVKDIARVLRVPGYYHHKEEPFMVQVEERGDKKFTFEELEEKFPFRPPQTSVNLNMPPSGCSEIDRLDIKEVSVRAFRFVGRSAEWDKKDRLVLDGRLTGTFKSHQGEFIASTSHEPFQGNHVTVVADILGVTNKEAYRWIKDEYNIEVVKQTRPEFRDAESLVKKFSEMKGILRKTAIPRAEIISTGYPEVDEVIGGIFPSTLCIVGARTGHGKSEMCKNIAFGAATQGKKVVMFDFENDRGDMIARELRTMLANRGIYVKKSDIRTKEFWEKHGKKAEEMLEGMQELLEDNLYFYSKGTVPTIDEFLEILDKINDVDLVVIDHLHYFSMNDTENQALQIAEIMRKVRHFTKEKQIPVVIASHVRNPSKERAPVESDLFGSSNISKEAECVIMPYRLPSPEGEVNTAIIIAKNRSEGVLRTLEACYDTKTSTLTIQPNPAFK